MKKHEKLKRRLIFQKIQCSLISKKKEVGLIILEKEQRQVTLWLPSFSSHLFIKKKKKTEDIMVWMIYLKEMDTLVQTWNSEELYQSLKVELLP